jgi:mannosyltransferase OCH1-like enzyme
MKYLNSWKEFCPDYEIIEWNEDNFDVNKNYYCKKFYDKKKWAFAADYARFDILYNE